MIDGVTTRIVIAVIDGMTTGMIAAIGDELNPSVSRREDKPVSFAGRLRLPDSWQCSGVLR